MTEKKFNLEAAKKGAVIKDGNGDEYEFIAHVPKADNQERVILLRGDGSIRTFSEEGMWVPSITKEDVYTEPITVTKYAILWMHPEKPYLHENLFETEGMAMNNNHVSVIPYKIIPITYEV